jgi:hypothetical protein
MKPIPALIAALSFMLTGVNAFALDPHVEAVIRTFEGAKGKVEKRRRTRPRRAYRTIAFF